MADEGSGRILYPYRRNKKQDRRQAEADELTYATASYGNLGDTWANPSTSGQEASFADCPALSNRTKVGLRANKFFHPTEIQRAALPPALNGADILGAAKTGSGKTLAFLIPILECLWRNSWTGMDGLGALIISPTRELALQTFNVLKTIGAHHDFSAALLIGGGTDAKWERARLGGTNIVVGTPGRILQQMDESPHFSADGLQILVLDEADRILDLGFSGQISAILENLPTERQTLLFSATQTKKVQDLARISVVEPVYVSVHEHAEHSTPDQLTQSYMVCGDDMKFDLLWSFIRNHLHKKILVFFATCKQVRFVYESFKRLRPGQTVLALHGFMNPKKRVAVYERFCGNRSGAVLFATDVAARGLDFPRVDWVVQLDCPPEASDYIHRCGRTARHESAGQSLLVLTPCQEASMMTLLAEAKIPVMNKIEANPKKMQHISGKLEGLCAADPNLKIFAQRWYPMRYYILLKSFVAYMRSLTMMKNKDIFQPTTVDLDALTKCYGLVVRPRLRFIDKKKRSQQASSKRSEAQKASTSGTQQLSDSLNDSDLGDFMSVKSVSRPEEDDDDSAHFCFVKLSPAPRLDRMPDPKMIKTSKKSQSKRTLMKRMMNAKVRINQKTKFTADNGDEDESSASPSNNGPEDTAVAKKPRLAVMPKKRKVKSKDGGSRKKRLIALSG